MSIPIEPEHPPVSSLQSPPDTGHAEIDAALGAVADLDEVALDEHADRLTRAHEILHGSLQGDPPH